MCTEWKFLQARIFSRDILKEHTDVPHSPERPTYTQ